MKKIDNFLNNITMYRLVLYYLICLLVIATLLSAIKVLAFNPWSILISTTFLVAVSVFTNDTFTETFGAISNYESVFISALILALIINPIKSVNELVFLAWAAVLTMASKFIFAFHKKHLFNPVAIAVALTALALNQSATWWIGTTYMFPFVLAGGLLIVRKLRRVDLVYYFFFTAITVVLGTTVLSGKNLITAASQILFASPVLFFAFVMLTEPLTTPPTKKLQIIYGALVGLLFAPQFHLSAMYFTPETALLVGNVFSFIVSPKEKLVLKLKEKTEIGKDIYNFVFAKPNGENFAFEPGQYMEWTLKQDHIDNRGNRRYLTVASSPTEQDISIGVKFYKKPSDFKQKLFDLKNGDEILAGQLAGDFTLSKNKSIKLAFIAGGIGITPFRSIIKNMIDTHARRDAILLYSNNYENEIVYKDIFDAAEKQCGLKTVYTLTAPNDIPVGWQGKIGFIDEKMLKESIPDFKERTFYISGPNIMVETFKKILTQLGIENNRIITDYFPGFA